ncbi:hypothetical protein NE236_41455 [Actinoallomurus purpureus]|uniref:hypothetical protein n=1 Tax=Actinoallomurus purpureus TaxID=478114 RepID=UPI002092E559|nr:hypothetical protein [Actinoallomurus purpureus]MCO6011436.1 hypothetical protein [Actinoallomurus purpureus]
MTTPTGDGEIFAAPADAPLEDSPWVSIGRLIPDQPPDPTSVMPDVMKLAEAMRPIVRQFTLSVQSTATAMHRSFAPLMYRDYRTHWRRCPICRASLRRGTVPPLKVNGSEYARRRRARRRNRR